MRLEIGACSRAKGAVNEDAYLIDTEAMVFGAFDGLGGTANGALAAWLAAGAIRAAYLLHSPAGDCAAERSFLAAAVGGAGALIAATVDDGLTTASVVTVCESDDGEATAIACNLGDSRVYRYTTAGELRQCTLDDSVLSSDWDVQRQLGDIVAPSGPTETAYFWLRHVMDHALGERLFRPHVWEAPVHGGDLLLAVTDGVSDNLTFSEIAGLLGDVTNDDAIPGHRPDPNRIAHRLVAAALARSRQAGHPRAKVDDTTAVVARVEHTPTDG